MFVVFCECDDESVGVMCVWMGECVYDVVILLNEDVFVVTARDASTTTRRVDGDGEIVVLYVSVD